MIKTRTKATAKAEQTKLDKVLAYCSELSDEGKERVCIIEDISKTGRLVGQNLITEKTFDKLYDAPIHLLEALQHNIQVELNTYEYKLRLASLL